MQTMQKSEKWTQDYSAGIRDAVIFFSQKDIIPKGRALVIVLLFSNNFDGIIETIRELSIRFGWEQMVIIATENVLKRFTVEYRDMTDQIDKYSISGRGMTWEHVNATFLELTGCKDQENVLLPTSSGAFVPADAKFVETLAEFNILSAKQCENKEFQTDEEREQFSSKTEESFYRGEKVEWFNFYFRTHVLKRQIFDSVESTISKILQGDQKVLSTVIISHEPGAGGTTFDSKNVMSLWRHKEESENNAKPLLLLIDDLEQSDLTFDDVRRQIYIEYRSNPKVNNLVCCCILCHRETEIHQLSSLQYDYSVNTSGAIVYYLKQKLDEPEKQWMDRKYKELEEKGTDYQPDHLLSFMILRKGCSQTYIRSTIRHYLLHIDVSSNEFELLAYTALLSTYTPKTKRGPSAFIPVECCDSLMGYSLMKTVLWEKNMSKTLKMFLVIEQKENASGKQVKMSHPALAEPVLRQILTKRKETLSALTQRFLDCTILQSSSYGRQTLINFTKEMLVRRLKEEYNDDRTTSFSPLVEEICNIETSWINARKILETVFTKILVNDHYIAQTLARLCSKHKDFEKGIEWGRLSVEMSMGNKIANGFCHQSLAICLDEQFKQETAKIQTLISIKDAVTYLTIILEAYSNFLDASRLRKGSADHILYPIQGVLNTIITCLKFIRKNVRCKFSQHVMMFISDEAFTPQEFKDWLVFKLKLNTFPYEGEKALAIIEQCLCFHTTFYAHDDNSHREHRLYRGIQYRYPLFIMITVNFLELMSTNCHHSRIYQKLLMTGIGEGGKNITQPTTHFFLTNGLGFKSLCHSSESKGTALFNSSAWERFVETYNIKRLKGDLRFHNGKTCIFVANEKSPSSELIEIRRIRSGKTEFNSQEEVYFYLGFSISGPIAYHVKPTRYEETAIEQSFWQDDDRVEKFVEEDEEQLHRKLNTIKDLKSKLKNGRHLKEREKELLKQEDDIRTAIDIKKNDPYQDD
ncbi:SAMD9 [Mytilus edulis]|uniref:SAMD9 n=1 Tax=Mytilus edulis TaxID=6550 RepID=A0A8S3UDY5_MYTED|nr:SAMD9 [Mytilus edulis]